MPPATMDAPVKSPEVEEDDGLGDPAPGKGRLPDPDDGTSRPNYGDGGADDPAAEPEPEPNGNGGGPPTPPAVLPEDEGGEEEKKDPLLFLLGNRELGVKVGGRKPDASVLKVKGGKIELEGQFDRGDRFPAVFDLQVTGDGDRDSIELETGTIKSTRKTQEATVCGTSTLSAYLARKLEGTDLYGPVITALGLGE